MIREATYDALPKATRAELHQRLADWLENHARDLVELDEIVGYHLDQAFAYRSQLGQPTMPDVRSRLAPQRTWAQRAALHWSAWTPRQPERCFGVPAICFLGGSRAGRVTT